MYGQHMHSPGGVSQGPLAAALGQERPKGQALFISPTQPPRSCSPVGHLSKELGAQLVPLRVAWKSPTLTKT